MQAVVFDYGMVLSLPQPPSAVEEMARVVGLPLDKFNDRYWRYRLDYDRADLDAVSFWNGTLKEEGRVLSHAEIDLLVTIDSEGWGTPDMVMLAWAEQLRAAGTKTPVLSNMPPEIGRYLVKHRPWLSAFGPLILSCDVREVKPDPAIYEHCLRVLHLAPGEVLFLDDKEQNVEGARRAGMHSIVFASPEETLPLVEAQFNLPAANFDHRGSALGSASCQ